MSATRSWDRAAAILAERRIAGSVVEALAETDRPADTADAAAIRDRVHARLAASRFGRRIGWKIGCTTSVMQTYLGIGEPCAAGLFAGTRHFTPAALPASGFRRIGVECEIAIRLARRSMRGARTSRGTTSHQRWAAHRRRSRSSTTAMTTGAASARRR